MAVDADGAVAVAAAVSVAVGAGAPAGSGYRGRMRRIETGRELRHERIEASSFETWERFPVRMR